MTVANLSVQNENVSSFTKPFIKGEEKWFPFADTLGSRQKDHVLYVNGTRKADLDSGKVAYEWSLRMIRHSLGTTYTFNSSWPEIERLNLDLTPLEEIFKTLGWDTAVLDTQQKVKVI